MSFLRFFRASAAHRDCVELRRRASDYLESDLPEEEKEHIRRHLEMCNNCTKFLETLRTTMDMLGNLSQRAVPQSLKDRLEQLSRNQGQGMGA